MPPPPCSTSSAAFTTATSAHLASLAPAGVTAVVRPDNPDYTRQDASGGCAALGYAVSADTAFSESFESLRGFHLVSDGLSQPFHAPAG